MGENYGILTREWERMGPEENHAQQWGPQRPVGQDGDVAGKACLETALSPHHLRLHAVCYAHRCRNQMPPLTQPAYPVPAKRAEKA